MIPVSETLLVTAALAAVVVGSRAMIRVLVSTMFDSRPGPVADCSDCLDDLDSEWGPAPVETRPARLGALPLSGPFPL